MKKKNTIRNMLENYFEIFLDCSLENCIDRDYKGNYKKAISGDLDNFIGISEPYEDSGGYDLTLDSGIQSVEFCSKKILKEVLNFIQKI